MSRKRKLSTIDDDSSEDENGMEADEILNDDYVVADENLLQPDLASHKDISAKRYPRMPKNTLFLGLFQGAIPVQLQELTMVEHSMIALYSNLTRIALQAGVHYHAKPTVYTVVNDLTTVMQQLPNFVTLHSFAILCHHTLQRVKQYQF